MTAPKTSEPIFAEPLHVGRPNIGDREQFLARINDMLDRRWLTNNGQYVRAFEQRIAELVGVKHCIATCNATIGLEIALRALGLEGEVIIPAFTFVATAHVLQWQGITPVFADIDPHTHNLDPERVQAAITPRTTGILGVHVWGRPCAIEPLTAIARRHGLGLLFDAAHAFACSHQGQMIGSFGNAEVFSFHATKFFNTFEGGAIVTNDDDLADRIRLMRNFGFAGMDNVVTVGTNGKMTEFAAAMGLTNLDSLEAFIEANRRNYDAYERVIGDLPGLAMVALEESERNNYQYVVIEVDEERAGLNRDELFQILHSENVLARRYFWPGCHRMEPYRTLFPDVRDHLPETERLSERVLVLPTGTSVSPADIATIGAILGDAIGHARGVQNPDAIP
jgi:dTDP-4-amino-4,6-dideoxygalactose transaminase